MALRICIFGAGAVGGHFAAQLAASGHEVSLVARGAQLEAIRRNGVILLKGERRITAKVRASADAHDLGPQDFVLVTLKATGLAAFADGVAPLLGPQTAVVFAQNGIPWWYAQGLAASRPAPPDLSQLDPGAALARAIDPDRVIGAVVYSANEVAEPGVVRNTAPGRNMLVLGELDGRASERVSNLSAALERSEIQAPIETDIRRTVWAKLLLNVGSSSIGVATEEGIRETLADPALRQLRERMRAEGLAIAAAHGVSVEGAPLPPPHKDGGPQHKTSMLQDYELGRPMEIDAILMAPLWFARSANVPAPVLEAVVALAAHKAAAKGLYG
jgi:2-dehydropantoate 2-reductase